MRAFFIPAIVVTTAMIATGCFGGGGKKIEPDKTISHEGGILNLSNVTSVSPKLEARAGAGDWTDLSTMNNNELEGWMKGKDSVSARSYIQFDGANLPIETRTVDNAGQLKSMRSELEKRMDAVDKFMKNDKKQLDARGW